MLKDEIEKYEKLGYQCEKFSFENREGVVVFPFVARKENPWIWRPEFFGAFEQADQELLKQGWKLVYITMSDQYGCPDIIHFMERFYTWITKTYCLSYKADLFGFSRGGLYALNFAAQNPEKVQTLYLDAPVIDLASWPGGYYGTAPHLEKEWTEACEAYTCTSEELKNYKQKMEKKFQILLEKQIPVILVAGLADQVVPYEENGKFLENYMLQKHMKNFKCIKKNGCDHHPHSMENPEEIVKFISESLLEK